MLVAYNQLSAWFGCSGIAKDTTAREDVLTDLYTGQNDRVAGIVTANGVPRAQFEEVDA